MKDVLEYTEEELRGLPVEKLKELYHEAEIKENLFNTRQLVEKLAINSLYGALGNKWFPLFNQDIARAITGNGRYFIHKLANYIEDDLQSKIPQEKPYIIYGDTDSVYYHIEPFMEGYGGTLHERAELANQFEQRNIQPVIQQCIQDFGTELNAYNPSKIGAAREIIADKAVFVAKKKYFARILHNEGTIYEEPKTKVMGLELVKSSTPAFTRKKLKESIQIILDSSREEMQEWISTIKEEYIKQPLGNIAIVSSVSNIEYTLGEKGIPIGARSALVYNNFITEQNLLDKYTPIKPGEKTKRLYLLEPNPLRSDIVAFTDDRFIEEFKEFIDYDVNFEKGFLSPLEKMTNALQWNLKQVTEILDDW